MSQDRKNLPDQKKADEKKDNLLLNAIMAPLGNRADPGLTSLDTGRPIFNEEDRYQEVKKIIATDSVYYHNRFPQLQNTVNSLAQRAIVSREASLFEAIQSDNISNFGAALIAIRNIIREQGQEQIQVLENLFNQLHASLKNISSKSTIGSFIRSFENHNIEDILRNNAFENKLAGAIQTNAKNKKNQAQDENKEVTSSPHTIIDEEKEALQKRQQVLEQAIRDIPPLEPLTRVQVALAHRFGNESEEYTAWSEACYTLEKIKKTTNNSSLNTQIDSLLNAIKDNSTSNDQIEKLLTEVNDTIKKQSKRLGTSYQPSLYQKKENSLAALFKSGYELCDKALETLETSKSKKYSK